MSYAGPKLLQSSCEYFGLVLFDRVASIEIKEADPISVDQFDQLKYLSRLNKIQLNASDTNRVQQSIAKSSIGSAFERYALDFSFPGELAMVRND